MKSETHGRSCSFKRVRKSVRVKRSMTESSLVELAESNGMFLVQNHSLSQFSGPLRIFETCGRSVAAEMFLHALHHIREFVLVAFAVIDQDVGDHSHMPFTHGSMALVDHTHQLIPISLDTRSHWPDSVGEPRLFQDLHQKGQVPADVGAVHRVDAELSNHW